MMMMMIVPYEYLAIYLRRNHSNEKNKGWEGEIVKGEELGRLRKKRGGHGKIYCTCPFPRMVLDYMIQSPDFYYHFLYVYIYAASIKVLMLTSTRPRFTGLKDLDSRGFERVTKSTRKGESLSLHVS